MDVNLELLLGRKVLAQNGRSIGRLEEVRADVKGGECLITEFLVGRYAVVERLGAWSIGRGLLGLFGSWLKTGYYIPWQKMDLSDPQRPRITCAVEELQPLEIKKSDTTS